MTTFLNSPIPPSPATGRPHQAGKTAPPPALLPLQQALANARSTQSRRRAARHIVEAYCSYYYPPQAGKELQLMYKAATSIQFLPVLKKNKKEGLLFFYEFTRLLLKAVAVLHRPPA